MKIKTLFSASKHGVFADLALLLLRVVAGAAFVQHGWPKIQKPFSWMGPDAFAPGVFQALAALAEFGGGIAWVLGLLMPLASVGIASTMAVAFWLHAVMKGDPFVSAGGGASYELAAVYFCISMLLLVMGPGRLSLDRKLFGAR